VIELVNAYGERVVVHPGVCQLLGADVLNAYGWQLLGVIA